MDTNCKSIQERREDCPNSLYHYTDLNALKGIIKEKKLVFWGTRFDSMNDPLDYTFAANIIIPKILSYLNQLQGLKDEETDYNEMYPYSVSFSENEDDESMWTHYGSEVALEIDTRFFYPLYNLNETIKFWFDKCLYVNEVDITDEFINSCLNDFPSDNIPSRVQYASAFIKRDAFARENEWRMFSADYKTGYCDADGTFYRTEIPNGIKVATVRDKDLILYKEFELPSEALKGIIINDCDVSHFHKVKSHIQLLLKANGFSSEKINIRQTKNYPLDKK